MQGFAGGLRLWVSRVCNAYMDGGDGVSVPLTQEGE